MTELSHRRQKFYENYRQKSLDEFFNTSSYSSAVRNDKKIFYGICIDTGASYHSVGGHDQFLALSKLQNLKINTATAGFVIAAFGKGSASSIGSIDITIPFGIFTFHILYADIPFLLSLHDMDHAKIMFNNLKDSLTQPDTGIKMPVHRYRGHAWIRILDDPFPTILEPTIFNELSTYAAESFLTEIQLRRLHRRFGHPSASKLISLLKRAGYANNIDKESIERLTRYCVMCQKHGKSPGRFKFTLKDDNQQFNYCVVVDILYLEDPKIKSRQRPVLHVVDEATRYQAALWLKEISAMCTWNALRRIWIDAYLGPPEILKSDSGTNFTAKEFKDLASSTGVSVNVVPVESHSSIGIVERYHAPLRRAYDILRSEMPEMDRHTLLQSAVKVVNDTAGPDGLVPTLLVYGTFPRITNEDPPYATTAQRGKAIQKAMSEVSRIHAAEQVRRALSERNGPNIANTLNTPLNSKLWVYRDGNSTRRAGWQGPYPLLSVTESRTILKLPSGPTVFPTTHVKRYYEEVSKENNLSHEDTFEKIISDCEEDDNDKKMEVPDNHPHLKKNQLHPETDNRRSSARIKKPTMKAIESQSQKNFLRTKNAQLCVNLISESKDTFEASRQKELRGLLELDVFEAVPAASIPEGTRIFGSRFVDEIKMPGTPKAYPKSRLVVQAFKDSGKEQVLTQSPTLQRVSQRILLSFSVSLKNHNLYLRDITQAYVQSRTHLIRDFYIKPPIELGLNKDTLLKVIKPLYGVPEAGNHWFNTYHKLHKEGLNMLPSTYDHCLLYKTDHNNILVGITGMQTDDTLTSATDEFAAFEQNTIIAASIMSKPVQMLTNKTPLMFNGAVLQKKSDNSIEVTQPRQCQNLAMIQEFPRDNTSSRGMVRKGLSIKDQFVAQRARGAYIASVCQPEATFDYSVAAQMSHSIFPKDITQDERVKQLNKRIDWQIKNSNRCLTFKSLDLDTVKLVVYTDASHANNSDMSSQIGYVIVMMDSTNTANLIHWSSIKCKRVTRSVLAAELYAMAHGFDMGIAIKTTITKMLGYEIPLYLCTDSKSLYECISKLGTTQEKRLMIDILCLRESYERREITELRWIAGNTNPADAMTKAKACPALKNLVENNYINLEEATIKWVERVPDLNEEQ